MHVAIVSPEVAPYCASGNLGEAVGSLATALAELGVEVTVFAPFYKQIVPERFNLARRIVRVSVPVGSEQVEIGLLDGKFPSANVSVVLVDHPESFQRPGIYGEDGQDYADNHRRFHLLCAAVPRLCQELDLSPDVIHLHDWQTAMLPLLLQQGPVPAVLEQARTVFTVHDPACAGLFDSATLEELGLGYEMYHPEGIEFHGQVSWLKAGLMLADKVTTCSPTFSREMQTEEFGFGFHGVMTAIKDKLVGIVPGVDHASWDSSRDHRLDAHFDAENLDGKAQCKRALLTRLEIPRRNVPLLVMLGRLDRERGVELMLETLPRLPLDRLQLLFWGSASPEIAARLQDAQDGTSRAVMFHSGQPDEDTMHQLLAGADGLLYPSRYEPSGLLQLKALRYGAVPVVRGVGGLQDTVVDFDQKTRTGTGFQFKAWEAGALESAVLRFLAACSKPEVMQTLMRNGMAQHYPWRQTARRYQQVYESL